MCLWFSAKIPWGTGAEKGTSTQEGTLDLKVHLEIREDGEGRCEQQSRERSIAKQETLLSEDETQFL